MLDQASQVAFPTRDVLPVLQVEARLAPQASMSQDSTDEEQAEAEERCDALNW